MRYAIVAVLLLIVVLITFAVLYLPGCIAPLVEPGPSWKVRPWEEQQESIRSAARQAKEILLRKNGNKPVSEWPEHEKRLWPDAGVILGDVDQP